MIDLPKLIELKREEDITRSLEYLQLNIASNGRTIEDQDYKTLIRDLTKILKVKQTDNKKMDREKFEALRLITNMGANKKGG